ncbi:hypothetical protein [uncultured Ruminococcus sp.]|uniref:hypothetical protein n=1 Tax=uncultured Ruminococcus sp. TaxID=165186 RepID=UPI000EBD65F4|nr:hypothetical protein [uncultured Ruminococcus sp.]HCJ42258.1 hypothetical protein [Ruminococcus sp.]
MFGTITGNEIFTASKRRINKPEFTSRLTGDADEIRQTALACLASHGVVYGLKNKQKECVCAYCFEKVPEPEGKHKRLVFRAKYRSEGTEDIDNIEAEFVKVLRAELKDMLLFTGVHSIEWEGEVVTAEDLEKEMESKFSTENILFLIFGVMIGRSIDNLAVCLCLIALALGVMFCRDKFSFTFGTKKKENADSYKEKI